MYPRARRRDDVRDGEMRADGAVCGMKDGGVWKRGGAEGWRIIMF